MSRNNFIRMFFSHIDKKSVKFSHFCGSSCISLSFSLLLSIFVFSFAEKFDILIEFLEMENARSFLSYIVSSFKLRDTAKIVSGL